MSQSLQEATSQAAVDGKQMSAFRRWWIRPLPFRRRTESPGDAAKPSRFRLGLFGDTRSGKTMYFAALHDITDRGQLPSNVNIKPKPGACLGYLNGRVAMIRSGQWPPGTIDVAPIDLVIDYAEQTYDLHSKDFKGGDFPNLADPKNKEEFNRFVDHLFEGCSAYVFLVDPGILKNSKHSSSQSELTLQQKKEIEEEALRVTTALAAAMEQTRCTGRVSHLFHRPIAIVFTKCDLHPDVMADPERYAATHLETVRRHLSTHAPKRHRFFAISSTGALSDGAVGPPVPVVPQRLTEPLTWCIDEHRKRQNVVKRFAIGAVFVLLAAGYALLYSNNYRQISDIRSEISTSADRDLPDLFHRATSLNRSVWTRPTHPYETERLRQEIAGEARRRMNEDISKHVDANGDLRELDYYDHFDAKVKDFAQSYPGTADTDDLRIWLKNQRSQLAKRTVEELEKLAEAASETAFYEMLQKYTRNIALPEFEERVKAATAALNKHVNRGLVSLLRDQRLTKPREIGVIRETLQKLENDIDQRRLPENDLQVKYVRKVRVLYDDLNDRGSTRDLHFELRSRSSYKWQWGATQNAANIASSNGWQAPATDPKQSAFYLQTSPKFAVDLFNREPFTLHIKENTYGGNGTAQETIRLDKLRFGEHQMLVTDEGTQYWVRWHDDEGIADHYVLIKEIESLEDELFRAKNHQ
jgi:hypothetical protein